MDIDFHNTWRLINSDIAPNTDWKFNSIRSVVIMIFACSIAVLSLKTISNQSQGFEKGLHGCV